MLPILFLSLLAQAAPPPAPPLVLKAGTLIDGRGGTPLQDAVVVIQDGKIAEVGTASSVRVPDGAEVRSLPQATLLPGFIDAHVHLVGRMLGEGDWQNAAVRDLPAEGVVRGVRNARVTLEAGFTTVRDLGTFRAFIDCALRDTINAGELEGPRMRCAGAFITAPWGGGDVVGLAHDITLPADLRFGVVTTPAEVRDRVRRLLIGGADLIKCIGTGAVLTRGGVPGAPELSEDELRTAVDEAAQYGKYVAVHAHGAEGAKRAIRAGARSLEHGSIIDRETVSMLADTGTFFGCDLFDGEWALAEENAVGWPADTMRKLRQTMETGIEAFRWAIDAGVRMTYTTDSGVYPHALVAHQLDTYVRYGMSPLAAIRSATVVAAECLGWADRVGSLRPGRFADLVAVEGDPLADVRVVESPVVVLKGGRVAFDRRPGG